MPQFIALTENSKNSLWKHQVNAVDFAINHLNVRESPCLLRMPTGTGKTGVIACLTKLANPNSSLILTPWAYLRNQMVVDLDHRFWNKVKLRPNSNQVVKLLPSKASEILEKKEELVIVATFATLTNLRLNKIDVYEALAEKVSLVIVDEGHYEPALEWGKSVRGLKTKTVLLTATPL